MVAVDYTDLLKITLPHNRHHFGDVLVVTTPGGDARDVARENGAEVFETGAFYDDGAAFNKWKALELGLDWFGRHGWMVLIDADVLWPRELPAGWEPQFGHLYTPRRRMYDIIGPLEAGIPPEADWTKWPLHRQEREFAGYSQIFHAEDEALGPPPWHEQNWRHAGGADSFFQQKWPEARKVRPPWEVLHLGPAGENWCGRVTPLLSGETPAAAGHRADLLAHFRRGRRATRSFDGEKL